jgi:CDGSH-type Zn-finger protein
MLRELQAGLESGIQASVNDPYLVTNAETLRNWLGEAIPAPPQMALCRCAGSQMKPFCDGPHARIGFTDQKDQPQSEQLTLLTGQSISRNRRALGTGRIRQLRLGGRAGPAAAGQECGIAFDGFTDFQPGNSL